MTVNFADVSHHQDSLLVGTYSLSRKTIALKATEGTGFTDPTFRARWAACKGLRRIAYHYAKARFNGADEFAYCWSVVKAAGFDPKNDVIALDIEDPDVPSRAAVNAAQFVNAAVKAGLTTGLVYTYPNYAKVNGIVPSLFAPGWRRLWFANYSNLTDEQITLPPGWTREQLYARQYTSTATIPGVSGTRTDDSRILRDWLAPLPTGGTVSLTDDDKQWIRDILGAGGGKTVTGVTEGTYNALHEELTSARAEIDTMHGHLMTFIDSQTAPPSPPTVPPTDQPTV